MKRDKILAIAAFVLLTVILAIIARTPPAGGYEISIYEAYPSYLWWLLIASVCCGVAIMLHHAFSEHNSNGWVLGFSIILAANLILLLLPAFRDYAIFGREDSLSHIGYASSIVMTGHTYAEDYYPVLHIFMVILAHITNVNMSNIMMAIVPFMNAIFTPIAIYFLASILAHNKTQLLLITIAGSLMIFSYTFEYNTFSPHSLAFLMFPFILYLYFKSRSQTYGNIDYKILVLITLAWLAFTHAITTLFMLALLILVEIALLIVRWKNKYATFGMPEISWNYVMILCVIFFIWFSSFSTFGGTVKSVYTWLQFDWTQSKAMAQIAILKSANVSLHDFLWLFICKYGHHILYLTLGLLASLMLWKKLFSSSLDNDYKHIGVSLVFTCGLVFAVVSHFSNFGWWFVRLVQIPLLAAVPLCGFVIAWLYYKLRINQRWIIITSTALLFILTSLVSTYNCYLSPITGDYNQQVTKAEITGMDWIFINRNDMLLIDDFRIGQDRFANLILGSPPSPMPTNIRNEKYVSPPDHFGYDERETLGESYAADRYVLLSKLSYTLYPEVYPKYYSSWRFYEEDFEKLNNEDSTVNHLYTNGEFDAYYVYSTEE